jgi:hypothetical protein
MLLGGGASCGLWLFSFFRGDPNGLDLQSFVRVEALFAIQTLDKLACSFADGSSNVAGIDFDRAVLRSAAAVFIFQHNVVRVQLYLL